MAESVRENINRALNKITCWGYYVGSIQQRVNSDFLMHEFPNSLVVANAGDYGTTNVRLGTRVQSGVLAQLFGFIEESKSYADITTESNFGDERRLELVTEAIKRDVIPEIACQLKDMLDWEDNTLLADEDAVVAAIMETEVEYYFETATSFYMDTSNEMFAQVIQAMLADYSVTMTKSLFAQIDDLFTGRETLIDCS